MDISKKNRKSLRHQVIGYLLSISQLLLILNKESSEVFLDGSRSFIISWIMWHIFTLVLCLVFSTTTVSSWKSELFISPKGNDTRSCGERNDPCKTVDYVYEMLSPSGFNSTVLLLDKGEYSLRKSLTFEKVTNFTILGGYGESVSNVDVEIICEPNGSLAFFLSENITLQGLKLLNCGGWQEAAVSSPRFKFKTAIHFDYCRNIWIRSVQISGSIGHAANFYETGGVLEVTDCVFENNTAVAINFTDSQETEQDGFHYFTSGGGIFLKLNKFSRNRPSFMDVTQAEHDTYIHGNRYIFTNCSFLRNEVTRASVSSDYFQEKFKNPFSGRGGGLGISMVGYASNSSVLIQNCMFLANKAPWGGGLMVEFADASSRNVLLVENSTFDGNVGDSAGGGARVGNMLTPGVSVPMNKVRFVNSTFRDNFGHWGGGVSIYGTSIFCKCKHKFNSKSIFSFHSCQWRGNKGIVGSAIAAFLFNQNRDHIGPEIAFHVEFNHSQVENNQVETYENNVRIGEGAIYSVDVSITFRGNTIIRNNNFTALVLDGGTLELHGNVEFVGNRGFRGGAVAMYGNSRIILMKKSRLFFKQNSCSDKGGAMFIQTPGSPQISYGVSSENPNACFLAYEKGESSFDYWDTRVIFQDNQAHDDSSGHSVFATSLKKCRKPGETRLNNFVLDWKFIEYIRTSDKSSRRLNQTDKREVATNPVDIVYRSEDWKVSPGLVFNPVVQLHDEKNNPVRGIIKVSVMNSSKGGDSTSVHLQTSSSLFVADGNIAGLKLGGDVGGDFTVVLRHVGRQILQRTIQVESLNRCNPGFYLKDGSCVCHQQLVGVSRCDQDGKTVYLKRGFWAGIRADGKLSTHRCPHGLCNCPQGRASVAEDECVFIAEEMCRGNREPMSILCGKCKKGFSVVFGDRNCFKCGNYDFFIMISIYLVVILGVISLAMVWDVDAFTGSLNGCLYFYQVMWQVIGEQFTFKDYFMLFILRLVNFRLWIGTHFCFSSHLDYADKLFFQLLTPAFVLFAVVALAKLVGRFPNWCFSRRVKAPFRAICTITVLCYTGITSACLDILNPAVIGDRTVLYISGETQFFRGKHAVYGSIAVLFLVFFVVPFPLILMFRPFFTRCLQPVFNLNRFKPIFDVLQSCFKDQHRWFAAFYFICRLVVLLIATYVPFGPVKRSLLEVTCITILFIFSYVRPYKKPEQGKETEASRYVLANRSDALLLWNLSLMAAFSSATENDNIQESHKDALRVLIQIMAYGPFALKAWFLYTKTSARCVSEWCKDDEDLADLPSETVVYKAA